MKIRSLLLGSIAAAGLTTAGYAADLGVVTSLDVCDELGISGLTISSDDTCLTISGSVEFTVDWSSTTPDADVTDDTSVSLDFEAVSPTDFGPATAFIGLSAAWGPTDEGFEPLEVDEAYVSVGDTTVVTAGYVTSLFESTVDVPDGAYDFDFFGPDFLPYETSEDGNVVSFNITHSVGDGLSIGGAVESEVTLGNDDTSIVGVVSYAGSGIAAQANFAYNTITGDYGVYAGFQGYFDPITVVALVSTDGTDYDARFGAAVVIDIFTLSGSVHAESLTPETTLTGDLEAAVTDTVTINAGSSYLINAGDFTAYIGVDVAVTETLTASFEVGTDDSAATYYGEAGLSWEPVADTVLEGTGTVYSDGTWTAELHGKREFD